MIMIIIIGWIVRYYRIIPVEERQVAAEVIIYQRIG